VQSEEIEPDKVVVLRNAVDLSRIPERPYPAAPRPQRALAFGKSAAIPELITACAQWGLPLDTIGQPKGLVSDHPEYEFIKYDLVFASSRGALEAICCGCAVIVCDPRGFGGLVTSHNYDQLRALNFGLRCLMRPVTAENILHDLGRYDAEDAARIMTRAREEADLERLLDHYEQLYSEVLAGPRKPILTNDLRAAAEARFLYDNLPRLPSDSRWPWLAERERLKRDNEALLRSIEGFKARIGSLETRVREQERELIRQKIEREPEANVAFKSEP
jgi:hypothetical protein